MKKGFTLIELLVVIGIIGALAGFAISKLGSADKAMQLASMKQDARAAIPQFLVSAANHNGTLEGFSPNDNVLAGTTEAATDAERVVAHSIQSRPHGDITVQVSPNNHIKLRGESTTCADGSPKFSIRVTSSKYHADNGVEYNSCTSNAVELVEE